MTFELQPKLKNTLVRLEPLKPNDLDALYAVASDPLIWEQHPSNDRWQREVFEAYFKTGLASGGAFCVFNNLTGELIGSSRYYDLDVAQNVVCVGYTFIARSAWGGDCNRALKTLMLDHAFQWVDRAVFHVGANNLRSRRAMEKLGGVYRGEVAPNVIYEIAAQDWSGSRSRYAG